MQLSAFPTLHDKKTEGLARGGMGFKSLRVKKIQNQSTLNPHCP